MDQPLVSIIIPSYNHAHYLVSALRSILVQSFDSWESIVVDDGSTDGTPAIVAEFQDPRIRYVYQHNQGLSTARNKGLHTARGYFVAFLDADDEWEPDFLRFSAKALQDNPALAGTFTHHVLIDEEGNVLPQVNGRPSRNTTLLQRLLVGGFFPPNAVLLHAAVVRDMGSFDPRLTSLEDWDLWLRIAAQHELQEIDLALARYRVYPGSMSTHGERMHNNRMLVLEKNFGPQTGDSSTWPEGKRLAYGLGYRSSALAFIQQHDHDEGWRFLAKGVKIWPDLLARLDTFYELACGEQMRGYRGQADLLDIKARSVDLLRRLDLLLTQTGTLSGSWRSWAYGNAYLALAMLSDQAGDWLPAWQFLSRAVRANPRLLRSGSVLRRWAKLGIRCAVEKMDQGEAFDFQQTVHTPNSSDAQE